MSSYELSSAELEFFRGTFAGGVAKEAVELSPDTVEALNIPTVSPEVLGRLEESAADVIGDSGAGPDGPAEQGGQEPETGLGEQIEQEKKEPEPVEPPSRLTHGSAWNNKRAHPLELLGILSARYGDRWVEWEPETLLWALRRDFGSVGELSRAKVAALRVAVSTDIPWQDWDAFEDCGQAWNDTVPIVGSFQPLTPMQAAFTVSILRAIRPGDEFAHEVLTYIAAILHDHGWVYAPEEYFDGTEQVLLIPPESLAVRGEVENAWKQINGIDPNTVHWREDSPVDIHLLKLATVRLYLEQRAQLYRDPMEQSQASPASSDVSS